MIHFNDQALDVLNSNVKLRRILIVPNNEKYTVFFLLQYNYGESSKPYEEYNLNWKIAASVHEDLHAL